ncbi:MAG: hypothetical protein IJ091_09890, partial [Oscillospiraceae bacterium]|nr:hypothetical protein [Oscillospiraceae bacterium]
MALRSFEDNSFAEMAIAGREFCKSAMNADIYGMMSSMSVADEREKMKQLLHTSVLYLRSRTRETKTHVAKEEMILDEVSKAYEEVAKYTNKKLLQTRMSYVIGYSKNGN